MVQPYVAKKQQFVGDNSINSYGRVAREWTNLAGKGVCAIAWLQPCTRIINYPRKTSSRASFRHIISFLLWMIWYYMGDAHHDDLCVFWLWLHLKLRLILVYFIEECSCIVILRIIAFNTIIICDICRVISDWIISTNCSYTNFMCFGYPFATNAVLLLSVLLRNALVWWICK